MQIANEKIFKIMDETLFQKELEWLEALQKAEGWVNESIISFCDLLTEVISSFENPYIIISNDYEIILDFRFDTKKYEGTPDAK